MLYLRRVLDKYGIKYSIMETKEAETKDQHIFALEIAKRKRYFGLYQCQHNMRNTKRYIKELEKK